MAQRGYSAPAQNQIRTPRATEYAAFAQITARMTRAQSGGPDGFPELAAALHENRKLWRLLALDVADTRNALPNDLRARLFFLYEFTDQHSSKVLERRADAAPLIEINTAIMRGLS
ncbi:flagellar protein FlaF [Rhodovulum bhavnagarense]|uniref:Flagellar protein FlaF n=2 Tax=Rhodovulum bhavnagarense TaxID=992286 RepID=A0A4R2RFF6_9RHOB|nr:flagellar protein FlaF [Rhodovulum bhavnagarense]